MNNSRIDILKDYQSKYNKGEITELQFLAQKKAVLVDEFTDLEVIYKDVKAKYDSIAEQIAEITIRLVETEANS